MKLNIGTMTSDECKQAISTIEELKVNLAKTKDIINEKAYKLVYYSLYKLQEGLSNLVDEKEEVTYDTSIINTSK